MSDGATRVLADAATSAAAVATTAPVADAARELIAGLGLRPWGQVAASVYETGRLVAVAPWLTGHDQRIAFLLRSQRPDGAWGPPEGYALVPTLSAIDALLAALADGRAGTELLAPVARGLGALVGTLLPSDARTLPDTPALDLIVPALVDTINDRLAGLERATAARLPRPPLPLPTGLTRDRLRAVRSAVAAGMTLPPKLAHFYEILDAVPTDAGPTLTAVGASPAATAAWLTAAGPAAGPAAHAFLRALIQDGGGPVPCPAPITVFERAWVLSGLHRAGITINPPACRPGEPDRCHRPAGHRHRRRPADRRRHHRGDPRRVGPARPSGGPGQPVGVRDGDGFCTWPGEDGFSVTTNAHVLDAFGQHLTPAPGRGGALSPGGRPAERGAGRRTSARTAPGRTGGTPRRTTPPPAACWHWPSSGGCGRRRGGGSGGRLGVGQPAPGRFVGAVGRHRRGDRVRPAGAAGGADDGAAGRRRRGAWTRLPARIRRRGAPSTVVRQGAVLSDSSSFAPRCSPPADWPASVLPAWTDRWWIAVTGQQKQQLEGLCGHC